MKYLLPILLLSFVACAKEDNKQCYRCSTIRSHDLPNGSSKHVSSETVELCDKTAIEIKEYEEEHTGNFSKGDTMSKTDCLKIFE